INSPVLYRCSNACFVGFQSHHAPRFGPLYAKSPTRSPPSAAMRALTCSITWRFSGLRLHSGHQPCPFRKRAILGRLRSEEHTSELQSRENLVCRLLLEKKKKKQL